MIQTPDEEETDTHNRLALCLSSAVGMYRSLGITEYPVWGLYIQGKQCELQVAQSCTESGVCVVIVCYSLFDVDDGVWLADICFSV